MAAPRSSDTFFLTGCARSGTTSLSKILDLAENACCPVEPRPRIDRECRALLDGRLRDPRQAVERIRPRIEEAHGKGLIHGEKNLTLVPFIPFLAHVYDCKFVFLHRDGREVVRSLLDWHNQLFGNIYRECVEDSEVTERALRSAAATPLHEDGADLARPRPLPGDPIYHEWEGFSRLEMCTWYWSTINALALDHLERLPDDRWIAISYSSPSLADEVCKVVEFLGLTGIDRDTVSGLLSRRINSLRDRTGERVGGPVWQTWPESWREKFRRLGDRTMQRLGYDAGPASVMPRPGAFGTWWDSDDRAPEDAESEARRASHETFRRWVDGIELGEKIESVLNIGCGKSKSYSEHFGDRRFLGYDISRSVVDWCRANCKNSNHEYVAGDIIVDGPEERFDLVFSQGTIDNVYDMNAHLRAAVRASRRWIYMSACRGWFPELGAHRYAWDAATTCFYNDVSPAETERVLRDLGCSDIEVYPVPAGEPGVENETVIVARVPAGPAS